MLTYAFVETFLLICVHRSILLIILGDYNLVCVLNKINDLKLLTFYVKINDRNALFSTTVHGT